jgi:hypothetical protein
MSQSRESVTVLLPPGSYIVQVEVFYGNPDKPERKAQLSPGLSEAVIKLAKGATVKDCLILVKQLNNAKKTISTYVYCCGALKPFNPKYHVLGWCCSDDEPEVKPEPSTPELTRPTLANDLARAAAEEQPFYNEPVEIEEPVEPLVLTSDLDASKLIPSDDLSLNEIEEIINKEDK